MAEHNWKLRLISPTEAAKGLPPDGIPWPAGSLVIGAFDTTGKLIGRIGMVELPHIEGIWVAEEHREGLLESSLTYALVERLLDITELISRDKVLAFVSDDKPGIGSIAERHGFRKLPLTVWMREG